MQRISAADTAAGPAGGGGGNSPNGGQLSFQQTLALVVGGVVVLGLIAAGMLLSTGRQSATPGAPAAGPATPVAPAGPVAQAAAPVQSSSATPQSSPTQPTAPVPGDSSALPAIVVYGGELTDAQRQALSPLFSTDGQVETETVSHEELVAAFQAAGLTVDGTERATSSAELTCLSLGAGLRVQTENISQLPAAAYANALVTTGITDASVLVAAPPNTSMTGETALVGVLKAYPRCHAGAAA